MSITLVIDNIPLKEFIANLNKMKLLGILTSLQLLAMPMNTDTMNLDKMKEVGESAYKIVQVSGLKPESALDIAYYVEKYETEIVDSDLVISIIKTESNFNPNAKRKNDGGANSYGLGQHKPFWKKHFQIKGSLYNPETSVKLTYLILENLMKKYNDLEIAVSAYNRGETRVDKDLKKGRNPGNKYSKKVLNLYNSLKNQK